MLKFSFTVTGKYITKQLKRGMGFFSHDFLPPGLWPEEHDEKKNVYVMTHRVQIRAERTRARYSSNDMPLI